MTRIIDYARLAELRTKFRRPHYSRAIRYNPRTEGTTLGGRHLRWIDNPQDGLRRVGYADEVTRIDHRGWFTNEFQDEVYRGIVYRLPTRSNGEHLFAYGYDDPNTGGAFLCFDLDAIDEQQAARYADRLAELYAEQEREYQEKWQAARRVEEARERIAAARAEHGALATELRTARKALAEPPPPHICAALRAALEAKRAAATRAVKEIRELVNEYGSEILTDPYQ
jgi:hypothetical protein